MIVIGGSTATGKSKFAYMLAKKIGASLISADSMQIYKGMDIGTAKEKNLQIRQYCIDIVHPSQRFSVVEYREHANNAIKDITANNKYPIVVGGTGLYIDSLLFDKSYGKYEDITLRNALEKDLERDGIAVLLKRLKKIDPISAKKIHPNNTRRIIRALEVSTISGQPFSSQIDCRTPTTKHKMYILTCPRQQLYERIDKRVDIMMASGLKLELKTLLSNGVHFDMQSMQGIGYKEWKDYFNNNDSLEEVAIKIKKNTRAYAKRQQTWFNNQYKTDVEYIDINADLDKFTDKIASSILI